MLQGELLSVNGYKKNTNLQVRTKQLPLDELAHVLELLRKQGKRIVLCHGVFDLLHIGHIRYLRQAREHGDMLVVTVTPDKYVDKGPHRPAFTETLRAEAVASLDCVDFVAINAWPTAENTLRMLRPDVYAKGAEFKNLEDAEGKIAKENAVANEVGTEVLFVEDIVFSSSNLINQYFSSLTEDCKQYLDMFRQRYSLGTVLEYLDRMRSLNVLVVGDIILDEYINCSPLGASSKDPVLAVHYLSQNIFAGGSAAIANQIAQHAKTVTLCATIGNDNKEEFIRKNLAPNVVFCPIIRDDAPTVLKQRVIVDYSFQKLLEIYHMGQSLMHKKHEDDLLSHVEYFITNHDIVVAADFGHGCINSCIVEALCSALFLAVNTQSNAGNRGNHTIGKYSKADFISLAHHEIEMEYRNSCLSTGEMMSDLKRRLSSHTILVTEGIQGCAVMQEDFIRAPSFAVNAVDMIGAGDALFSVASLGAALDFPAEMIAFLGNISGALAVGNIGNAKVISRQSMDKFVTAILK